MFVSLSPASGSVLKAQSLEPASDSVFSLYFVEFSYESDILLKKKKIDTYQMTFAIRTMDAAARCVPVWRTASEPDLNAWGAMISSP